MLRLLVSRALFAVPVLILVSMVAFTLLRLAPGDPALLQAGADAPPEAIEAMRQKMHLDQSIPVQYLAWAASAVRGDLGNAYGSGQPVLDLIAHRLPVTVQLSLVALLLIIVIGVPLGIWSALRQDKPADQFVRVGSLVGISVPNVVIAIFLVLIFGWWVPGVLPYQGFVRFTDSPLESLQHSVLPAFALAAPQIGLVARLTRSSMLEILGQDYISAARAMGVRERVVVWKDALRNALLPVVTVLGVITGFLLGGSVVVESVFGIPGVGRLLIESFGSRDYPVTIGVMMFIAVVFVVVNIVVDLLYGVINPRIKLGYESRKA
ncbi:ABC transporter permease [Dactylosporangium sucinum]|uniref:ABC di/oligopeptide transporter inner membrane subunit n=1 Tax=Dactylosporangium sucinum TaxID=1424081 RepID=A0A917U1D4_9ACTN|nr:ABC transporter permease [Dactylosporangium sucinum]GGM45810.1 ABC di/oligopeptide transporter inner membrane subunit [Dactylosporangium sucinum]